MRSSPAIGPTAANVRSPGAKTALDDARHVVGGDVLDLRDDLVDVGHDPERELGTPDAMHPARRALEPERHRPCEVADRALQLVVGDPAVGDEAVELGVEHVEHFLDPLRRGAAVHRERAGVGERAAVREHGVREAATLAHLLEQPRAHAATEHLVEHGQRETISVVAWQRPHPEHEVGLLQRTLDERERRRGNHRAAVDARRAIGERGGGQRALHHRDHVVVTQVAGRRDHDVRGLVVRAVIARDRVA